MIREGDKPSTTPLKVDIVLQSHKGPPITSWGIIPSIISCFDESTCSLKQNADRLLHERIRSLIECLEVDDPMRASGSPHQGFMTWPTSANACKHSVKDQ